MTLLATAVAVAVLTGAMVVGWSLQSSLERELLSRTGQIRYAVRPAGAFDARLAENLRAQGVAAAAVTRLPAAGLNDLGTPRTAMLTLWGLTSETPEGWPEGRDLGKDEVILSPAAAHDLAASVGDWIVIRADTSYARPAAGLFHYRDTGRLSRTLRLRIREISGARYATFSLAARQARPRNAFIRADLLPGGTNLLLAAGPVQPDDLRKAVLGELSLGDVGVKRASAGGKTYLYSDVVAFPANVATLLLKGAGGTPVATHIAQEISASGKHVSYGVVASSVSSNELADDEVLLNAWVAEDLGVKVGGRVTLKALISRPDGSYTPEELQLRVARIERLGEGLFVPQVTPELEGMTSADRMDDWQAPFPVDMSLVTRRDDEYWEQRRATPKAVVSASLMQKLWKESGFIGDTPVTTIVIDGAVDEAAGRKLARQIAEGDARWSVIDVRQAAEAASKGSTDFAGLFGAMSAFVVLASLMVAVGVVRTSLEARSQGLGLASALGIAGSRWRWAMLMEEGIASIPGIAAGMALGVLYAKALLWMFVELGSSTWELPRVTLDIRPVPLVVCAVAVCVAVLGAARLQMRHILKRDARELLAGAAEQDRPGQFRRRSLWRVILLLSVIGGAGVVLARQRTLEPTAGFFVAGICVLAAGWLMLRRWCMPRARHSRRLTVAGLALGFLTESPRRARLTFAMFCAAAFVVCSVAMFRSGEASIDPHDRTGATGGLSYRLVSPVAYRSDLSTGNGRATLGLPERLPEGVRLFSLLASRGVEGGCLNLASPGEMQVLGVGHDWVERGEFDVRTADASERPWTLLETPTADGGAVPVFGDEETMQWIEYRRVGDEFTMPIDGRPVRLRLAGVIRGGLFSGQLLMSDANLRRLSANAPGYGMHFVETTPAATEAARQMLSGLFDYGFSIEDTPRIIDAVRSVQRLYMSMFVVLGSLGLLLGAVGSAAVLVRDAAVRRGSLAMLQAVGLSRGLGAGMLIASHLTPILAGLATGMLSAAAGYLAFGRPIGLGQPLAIAAAIAVVATLVVAVAAVALQPRRVVESLRSL